jgi:hypothetical protein
MKLRLSILLLAAAALAAAPAAGQTIKSLGYNTTNGNVVYGGTNTLTFTNTIATSDIEIGPDFVLTETGELQWSGLSRFSAETMEFYAPILFANSTNAATTRTNLGLGATNDVSFSTVTSTFVATVGGLDGTALAPTGIQFNGVAAATTRTNLGLGATWLTNTSVTNFRTAIGLGATNYPTFAGIEVGGGDELQIDGAGIFSVGFDGAMSFEEQRLTQDNQDIFSWDTNSFAVAPAATFGSNVSVAGTLTVTGNATLNGVGNTAPQQTADSGSSLMTRELSDNNPIQTIGTVRPVGAFGFSSAGGGTASANHAFGGADVRSGTNTNGFGRASLYRGLNNNNNFTGSGIKPQNMSISVLFAINNMTTNSVARLIVGSGGFQNAAPLLAPADSNALSARGFGVEIARTATTNVYPLPTLRARLFAHDGTNYHTSAYTSDFHAFDYQQQFIVNYSTNGLVTLQRVGSLVAPSRPSSTPELTLTNGPTSTFGGAFIDWAAVNRSDIAPTNTLHTIYYGGMVEVKD